MDIPKHMTKEQLTEKIKEGLNEITWSNNDMKMELT